MSMHPFCTKRTHDQTVSELDDGPAGLEDTGTGDGQRSGDNSDLDRKVADRFAVAPIRPSARCPRVGG